MRAELNIFDGYNRSYQQEANPAELLNMYVAKIGDKQFALFRTGGLSSKDGIRVNTSNGVRKLFVSQLSTNMHSVIGDGIYQIDSAHNYTHGININTDSGYIGVADNDYQILFVDGVDGWVYDKTTNLYSQVASPGFPSGAADATYLAGRFIVIKKDTNEVYYSEINDATSWDANNRFDLTSYPDECVACQTLEGRLYIFGKICTEIWYPTENALQPYARDTNQLLEYGCVSRGTIVNEQGILCWAAGDKKGAFSVAALMNGELHKVSTISIESAFDDYSTTEDAQAYIIKDSGHTFYILSLTTANKSWSYNFTTRSWQQLSYKAFDRYLGSTHAYFNKKHFVGNYQNPIIYQYSRDYYDNDGVAIRRHLITPRMFPNKGKGFVLDKLSIVGKQGIGLSEGNNIQPYIELQLSRDGGRTYGNTLSEPMGKIGVTEWRVDFYRLGTMDSVVISLDFYNATDFSLLSAYVDISGFEQ